MKLQEFLNKHMANYGGNAVQFCKDLEELSTPAPQNVGSECEKCHGTGIYFFSDRVPTTCSCKREKSNPPSDFASRKVAVSDEEIRSRALDYETRAYAGQFAGDEPRVHYEAGAKAMRSKMGGE